MSTKTCLRYSELQRWLPPSWSPRSPPEALNLPDYQLGNLHRSRFPAASSVQPLVCDRCPFPRAGVAIVLAPPLGV